MKTTILLALSMTQTVIAISQNKKEQIEFLNARVDSCLTVIKNQQQHIRTLGEEKTKLEFESSQNVSKMQAELSTKKKEAETLAKNLEKHVNTIDSLSEMLKSFTEFQDVIVVEHPPSEWGFVEPKNTRATIYSSPDINKKTRFFFDELTSAGEIRNGFMLVDYLVNGQYMEGWALLSELKQGASPKAGPIDGEEEEYFYDPETGY